ncbi:MAG: hypothetical protein HZB50_19200 [Chloroflexi bacterium]|nr:hypothetical protein [Chloroflexota bacterium]
MEINYSALSAWATAITVLIAVIAIWLEARRTAVSRGVDILMKYSSEFSSDEFLTRRQRFAKILKKKMKGKLTRKDQNELVALATFFLDHYEVIGFLLRKKILDKQLVYVYYSYTLIGYWRFLKEVIDTYKKDEPTLWEDAEWLHHEFVKLYKKRVPAGAVELTDNKIKDFIETELS